MKKFLNESDKKKIISEKEKMIIESFAKTFNKIKRIDENEINEVGRNLKDIIVNIPDEHKLKLIKNTSALSSLFSPYQLKQLQVGDNKISVNHYVYSKMIGRTDTTAPFNVRDAINEIDDDFEKQSRESEYGMNPYKDEELFVIDYNEDGEDIIVQTSDRVTEKYHYVSHEVEGVSPNDATVFITFANDKNTREIIAKTDYTGGDVLNFDNLNFVSVKNTINEAKSNNDTYFETLSETLDAVRDYATKLGYELDEDVIFSKFGTGGISYETYKSANIPLLKNGEPILNKSGKEMNRAIHVSIYRMPSGKYELTMYKTY